MTTEEISKELKQIRLMKGLKIIDLELDKNLDHKKTWRVESSRTNYQVKSLLEYCEAVGIEIKFLPKP